MSKLDQLGKDLLDESYKDDDDLPEGFFNVRYIRWDDRLNELKVDMGSIEGYNTYPLDEIIEHLYSRITDLEKQLQQKGE